MLKERMIATLPSIFKGDERQVLVDWINNMDLSRGIDNAALHAKGGMHKAEAIFLECGYGSVSFEAMRRCQEAGLNPFDYEKAAIRVAFSSIWAIVKKQRSEVREAVAAELGAFAVDEALEMVARL